MRILLYSGKGGVGKTTLSALTGLRCSRLGYRTLVLSADSAHSIGDIFNCTIGSSPKQVETNLFLQEIDIDEELKEKWGVIKDFITHFLKYQGVDNLLAEECAIIPGMEELFFLLKIKEYLEEKRFDVLIVDCAPTAAVVRMLSLPDAFKWYMDKIFSWERKILKTIKPVADKVIKFPLPEDNVFEAVEKLYQRMKGMNEILKDPKITSIRLVLNLENMVIRESQRVFSYLNLFGFPIDSVYVNKVIPSDISGEFIGNWREAQKQYLSSIYESFSSLRILQVPHSGIEVSGLDDLNDLSDVVFGSEKIDPSKRLSKHKPYNISATEYGYKLRLPLPGVSKGKVDCWTRGEEVFIKINNFHKNIILPRALLGLPITGARLERGNLTLNFEDNYAEAEESS